MENRVLNPWMWQDRLGFAQAREVGGAARAPLRGTGLRRRRREAGSRGRHAGSGHAVAGQPGNRPRRGLADVVRLNYDTTDVDAFFESYDAAA